MRTKQKKNIIPGAKPGTARQAVYLLQIGRVLTLVNGLLYMTI